MIVTRFAPSPNGQLHLGHAFSAIVAHDLAQNAGGKFLLRIEDIDGARSKPDLAEAFRADLRWLGLDWVEVSAQSARLPRYEDAAARLRAMGLIYPCTCTRSEIAAAAREDGPEGPVYPGTCLDQAVDDTLPAVWRLDVARALSTTGPLEWTDAVQGVQRVDVSAFGDPVIVRKDDPASYHLAVTLDDATDGVTLVTRGQDLFPASNIHRILQALLNLPVPVWHHHRLVLDEDGNKLAKRRDSRSLSDLRNAGVNGIELGTDLRAGRLGPVNTFSKD